MEFTFETNYDKKTLTALAKAMRKTIRKKKNRRTHIFGWIIIVIGLLLSLPKGNEVYTVGANEIVTWAACGMILIVLLFEDRMNGALSAKRMAPGNDKMSAFFGEEGYHSKSDLGSSDWHYDKIDALAETKDYFVFLIGDRHGQILEKARMTGGTVDEFRSFIEEKTGKKMQYVK